MIVLTSFILFNQTEFHSVLKLQNHCQRDYISFTLKISGNLFLLVQVINLLNCNKNGLDGQVIKKVLDTFSVVFSFLSTILEFLLFRRNFEKGNLGGTLKILKWEKTGLFMQHMEGDNIFYTIFSFCIIILQLNL